jgi:heme A synthase
VYVGAVVIVASVVALAQKSASATTRTTGVPARTTRRWLRWWRGPFVATTVFVELAGRLVPAVDRRWLPASILERLSADASARVERMLAWLAPITTTSTVDGSRLLRGLV